MKVNFNLYFNDLGGDFDIVKKVKYLPRKGDTYSFDDFMPYIFNDIYNDNLGLVTALMIDILIQKAKLLNYDVLNSKLSIEDLIKHQDHAEVLKCCIKNNKTLIHADTFEVKEVYFRDGELPHVLLKEQK